MTQADPNNSHIPDANETHTAGLYHQEQLT